MDLEARQVLGKFLADARTKLGATLRGVESATGVSNSYLSQLESGRIAEPSPTVLHKLCSHYGSSYARAMKLAGYAMPGRESGAVETRLSARLGPVSNTEVEELASYLDFIRSKKGKT